MRRGTCTEGEVVAEQEDGARTKRPRRAHLAISTRSYAEASSSDRLFAIGVAVLLVGLAHQLDHRGCRGRLSRSSLGFLWVRQATREVPREGASAAPGTRGSGPRGTRRASTPAVRRRRSRTITTSATRATSSSSSRPSESAPAHRRRRHDSGRRLRGRPVVHQPERRGGRPRADRRTFPMASSS